MNMNLNFFVNCYCSLINGVLCKFRFGLRSGGGRWYGIRVFKLMEDGGGEKGGGNFFFVMMEELEKDFNFFDLFFFFLIFLVSVLILYFVFVLIV